MGGAGSLSNMFRVSYDRMIFPRQLGFHHGVPRIESHFGLVSPDFAMDNVNCTGTIESLQDCSYRTKDDCVEGEGAGVQCYHGEKGNTKFF